MSESSTRQSTEVETTNNNPTTDDGNLTYEGSDDIREIRRPPSLEFPDNFESKGNGGSSRRFVASYHENTENYSISCETVDPSRSRSNTTRGAEGGTENNNREAMNNPMHPLAPAFQDKNSAADLSKVLQDFNNKRAIQEVWSQAAFNRGDEHGRSFGNIHLGPINLGVKNRK